MYEYTQPKFERESFNCPHCGTYATQSWNVAVTSYNGMGGVFRETDKFNYARCQKCEKISMWKNKKMIYPSSGTVPMPDPLLPQNIQKDYLEARSIVITSPRSACVLLRYCVEEICKDKKAQGNTLDTKIKDLLKHDLDGDLRKSLDVVRLIGNDAVHNTKHLQIADNEKIATKLFLIINYIASNLYRLPNMISELTDKVKTNSK